MSSIFDRIDTENELTIYINKNGNIHEEKVNFIKTTPAVTITSVTSSANDSPTFTDNTININHSLLPNEIVTYTITVKNNQNNYRYQFRNILSVFSSNNFPYDVSIDLSEGIFVYPENEYTFSITYSNTNNTVENIDIIELELREEATFGGATDHLITIASPEYATLVSYGDFSVDQTSSNYYTDNDGNLEYDENGALVLDNDNMIAILDIDQSMSIADSYSLYFTIKGDYNQMGYPTRGFGATVLAVSEANQKYLSWISFYNNYINVYSYYNGAALGSVGYEHERTGFVSFNVANYSNQVTNYQITSTRGGQTSIYINGVLIKSFASGINPVSYTFATIGDLRPGRGLKFNGVIYDLVLYNKELSSEEIAQNWEHARQRWNIE